MGVGVGVGVGGQGRRDGIQRVAPVDTLGRQPRWEEAGVTRRWFAGRAHLHRIATAPALGFVTVLALVAASVAGTVSPVPAGATGSQVLGVYAGAADPPAVPAFAAKLGTHLHFAMDFLNGSTWRTITQPRYPYAKWKGKGYTMVWGVNMLPDTYTADSDPSRAGGSCAGLTQGATGAFDHYFQTVATNIVNAGFADSIIRPGWEFNGGWFPWAAHGCASAYAKYFANIVTTMRAVPGEHFTFEWNPTRGDLAVGDLANYYPGDAYVDYVGLDVYDVESQVYPGARAEFRHMQTQAFGLDWLSSFAATHHKQIVLPEWGLGWGTCSASGQRISDSNNETCGGDNATWINLMAKWIASHNVYEATFWDFGTSSVRSGHNPKTAAALAVHFGVPK